ncbi:amino acid ABC transporter permease [Mesorhizobium sp. 8]|uniref:amino acid ABC transporter permease n=1 Tax=Mesorhizobium sp. 8 TaxID=2584466 RepID=UPI0011219C7D|nr:amino acid ABC transporter permease [Mesorhizobium sp. 8]QDC01697.1 amino acid ABC transporter permease [Mesorhizobium sp. 8]
MTSYTWSFGFVFTNGSYLLAGLLGALQLAIGALVLGGIIGLPIGLCRVSRFRVVRILTAGYVNIFRNTPAVVQLLWFYYALPILLGIQLSPFVAALIAFSLATAAYVAEIVRAGIEAIPRGQSEAATALGLNYFRRMRLVILPQALRHMIPAFTNQAIDIVKLTAISSMIAYGDLVYHAQVLATQEFRPIEAYSAVAVIYSLILIPLSHIALRIEKHYRRRRTNQG